MTIYEITAEKIIAFDETFFQAVGLRERDDLHCFRLLPVYSAQTGLNTIDSRCHGGYKM